MYTFDLLEGVTSCDTINGACKLYRKCVPIMIVVTLSFVILITKQHSIDKE